MESTQRSPHQAKVGTEPIHQIKSVTGWVGETHLEFCHLFLALQGAKSRVSYYSVKYFNYFLLHSHLFFLLMMEVEMREAVKQVLTGSYMTYKTFLDFRNLQHAPQLFVKA